MKLNDTENEKMKMMLRNGPLFYCGHSSSAFNQIPTGFLDCQCC